MLTVLLIFTLVLGELYDVSNRILIKAAHAVNNMIPIMVVMVITVNLIIFMVSLQITAHNFSTLLMSFDGMIIISTVNGWGICGCNVVCG